MSLTLNITQLRADLLKHCGVLTTDPGFNNDGCDLLLNRSLWALMNMFPFRQTEDTKLFDTTIGEPRYTLPTLFEAVRQISIEDDISFEHSILDPMTILEYEAQFIDTIASRAKPTHYIRYGTTLRLFPTPDAVYSIVIKHVITLADLDDDNTGFPIPKNWYEIVLYGGIYRGYFLIKNPAMAKDFEDQQAIWINAALPVESKEEIDRHKAGVSIKGYEPNASIYGPS
jgi:hypothetical protein